jgi:hypothetical protein
VKRAVIRARRRLADGRRLVQVVCPVCEHRHWLREDQDGFCSRRDTTFELEVTK